MRGAPPKPPTTGVSCDKTMSQFVCGSVRPALSPANARKARPAGLLAKLAFLGLLLCSVPQPALSAPACNPDDPNQVRLDISVSGMHTTEGNITITIYPNDAEHFLDGKYKLARQHLPVMLPVTHACFVMAAPGDYAVALFGDENGNGHFDTNFLGIPVEGYGFSNNPTLFLGPPDLDEVRIAAHKGDNPIAVEMKYY